MYEDLDQETFDSILAEVIQDEDLLPWDLLQIPGIYEILSEYYNNKVLEYWEERQQAEKDLNG